MLDRGANVAVVTDAGTPGISDPGERLVRAAVAGGHEVTVVPGPAAAVAALVVSGLPAQRWVMEGFLPRSGRERTDRLAAVAAETRTTVLYEAPHRVGRTLADLRAACGSQRPVVLARELTKLHEEVWRGTLGAAVERAKTEAPRGEHVIVVAGASPTTEPSAAEVTAALEARLAGGMDRKTAVAEVAAALGAPKRAVYDAAVALKDAGSTP